MLRRNIWNENNKRLGTQIFNTLLRKSRLLCPDVGTEGYNPINSLTSHYSSLSVALTASLNVNFMFKLPRLLFQCTAIISGSTVRREKFFLLLLVLSTHLEQLIKMKQYQWSTSRFHTAINKQFLGSNDGKIPGKCEVIYQIITNYSSAISLNLRRVMGTTLESAVCIRDYYILKTIILGTNIVSGHSAV